MLHFRILDKRTGKDQSVVAFTDRHRILESVTQISWMDNALGGKESDILSKKRPRLEGELVRFLFAG